MYAAISVIFNDNVKRITKADLHGYELVIELDLPSKQKRIEEECLLDSIILLLNVHVPLFALLLEVSENHVINMLSNDVWI